MLRAFMTISIVYSGCEPSETDCLETYPGGPIRAVRVGQAICLLGLLVGAEGCYRWVPIDPPYAEALAQREPGEIRVTLANEWQYTFRDAALQGDTLMPPMGYAPDAIVLQDVVELEVREPCVLGTVGIVAAAAAIVVLNIVNLGDED